MVMIILVITNDYGNDGGNHDSKMKKRKWKEEES